MRLGGHIFLLIIVVVSIVSCRSAKQIAVKKNIPSITEGRLLKNIENNELEYSTLFAKKMDISYKDGKGSNSLKASLKIKRDSFIQANVTAPLGIGVARILLTKDSIKFVDTYHKNFFVADYDYFYDKFDVRVSFDCVEKIITNAFFDFQDCAGLGKEKKYKLDKTELGYELSTVEMSVSVNYGAFKQFSEKNFPEKIVFQLAVGNNKTSLELKFLKIDFDVPLEPNFKISPKFKRIE